MSIRFFKSKVLTLTLLVMLYVMGSVVAQQNPFADSEAKLEAYAHRYVACSKDSLGYPGSQDVQLKGFYEWLVASDVYKLMINNAGDPFKDSAGVNSIKLEREVLEYFAPKYGFTKENFWGLITASGTDGNNHGIYFGRKYLESITGLKPIVYVSQDAHYSNFRLCDLQNLEVRLIETDVEGRMIPKAFERALDPTRPALVVYAMGTTFKGGIDDQAQLNAVLARKKPVAVYRHVDAALFGGFLPFTDKKDLVNRNVNYYDSIAISGHKFYGLNDPAGLFLTTRQVLAKQKSFNVAYLNGNMPMISCSRSGITPLKFWWLISHGADERWTQEAQTILANAKWFYAQLKALGYPCYLAHASNTVYFKRPSQKIVQKYSLANNYDKRLGGELSHVVVMQHVSQAALGRFLADLKREIQ